MSLYNTMKWSYRVFSIVWECMKKNVKKGTGINTCRTGMGTNDCAGMTRRTGAPDLSYSHRSAAGGQEKEHTAGWAGEARAGRGLWMGVSF